MPGSFHFSLCGSSTSEDDKDLQHYQFHGNTNVTIAMNAMKIMDSILQHYGENVFSAKAELKCITSSSVIPP